MKNKFKSGLIPQDKAHMRALKTLLSARVINKTAVETLIGSMSNRIKPNQIKWKKDGSSLNNVYLTEDLKPAARAAAKVRKARLSKKP